MQGRRLIERRRLNTRNFACLVGMGLLVAVSAIASAQGPQQSYVQRQPHMQDGGNNRTEASTNWVCNLGAYTTFTLERQVDLGRAVAGQIDSQLRFVNDPAVLEYVNRIGQNLARQSTANVAIRIKVIDSRAVNALALPDGLLYISSGLLLAADEETELAGVVAHEIAHIAVCHAGRVWTSTERVFTIPSIPITVTPDGSSATGLYGIARFPRGLEAEADYLGILYMYRAGYDPSGLISFLRKIHEMQRPPWNSEGVATAFVTHPQSQERAERSEKEIAALAPASPEYIVTNSEFDDIKARLEQIANKHKF